MHRKHLKLAYNFGRVCGLNTIDDKNTFVVRPLDIGAGWHTNSYIDLRARQDLNVTSS